MSLISHDHKGRKFDRKWSKSQLTASGQHTNTIKDPKSDPLLWAISNRLQRVYNAKSSVVIHWLGKTLKEHRKPPQRWLFSLFLKHVRNTIFYLLAQWYSTRLSRRRPGFKSQSGQTLNLFFVLLFSTTFDVTRGLLRCFSPLSKKFPN